MSKKKFKGYVTAEQIDKAIALKNKKLMTIDPTKEDFKKAREILSYLNHLNFMADGWEDYEEQDIYTAELTIAQVIAKQRKKHIAIIRKYTDDGLFPRIAAAIRKGEV